MPGVLIVEAMAQMGGLLMSQQARAHRQDRGPAQPGQGQASADRWCPVTSCIMEAETIRATARTGNVKCRSFVGDKVVAEAQIKFMMVDSETE